MESAFSIYAKIGFYHIADINAYDHILFVVALCAIYKLSEWKRVAILVTAFTIGHSVTLALAGLDVITFPKDVIELLIPVTIVLTCLYNIFSRTNQPRAGKMTPSKIAYLTRQIIVNYFFAFFFGLIHGMGFSNYLKSVLDADESLVWLLFAFNVGLEIGQLMIVAIIFVFAYVAMDILKVKQRTWNIVVSSLVGFMAIGLILQLLCG
ncbi:MAG: HupE/UreJ family protein [Candidatus Marinimicrobia bacterium]|nr:HupE/UreJ family protein [Candidatus Neomarinimicrobiota bacterium]